MSLMKIHSYELGHIGTNCYIILPDGSDGAIVVDAPLEAAGFVPEFLKKCARRLDAILLTHPHWDHIWDAAPLAAATGAKIYAAADAVDFIENPQMQKMRLSAPGDFPPAKVDVPVRDGELLDIDGVKITCLSVPGHCPGSVAYLMSDSEGERVFVGDLLFNGSVGRTDFYGGSFEELERSIRGKIYALDDSVEVMPGHGPSTTVGAERRSNPYVCDAR